MKITGIHTYRIAVPLVKPFKTALRTVHTAEAVIVKMSAENAAGWGKRRRLPSLPEKPLTASKARSKKYSHRL